MSKYKIEKIEHPFAGEIEFLVEHLDNGVVNCIPKDPANSDYQRYLRWLENPDAEENGTLS